MMTTSESLVKLGFYATAIVFNICLIAQVLTVGVAFFSDPAWWQIHVWLVRGYSGLSLVLLGWSAVATQPDVRVTIISRIWAEVIAMLPIA